MLPLFYTNSVREPWARSEPVAIAIAILGLPSVAKANGYPYIDPVRLDIHRAIYLRKNKRFDSIHSIEFSRLDLMCLVIDSLAVDAQLWPN